MIYLSICSVLVAGALQRPGALKQRCRRVAAASKRSKHLSGGGPERGSRVQVLSEIYKAGPGPGGARALVGALAGERKVSCCIRGQGGSSDEGPRAEGREAGNGNNNASVGIVIIHQLYFNNKLV